MNKLSKFSAISAVVMLIIAVLYAIQFFFHGIMFCVPIHVAYWEHPFTYIDLYNISKVIRCGLFATFFAMLYGMSSPKSAVRKSAMIGLIVSIICIMTIFRWRLSVFFVWVSILGIGIPSLVIAHQYKNKLFSAVTIAYFVINLLSFVAYRALCLYYPEIWTSIFSSNWAFIYLVRYPILPAAYFWAFSKLKSDERS